MWVVVPALAAAALLHRSLHIHAPSNILIRRVRASRQTVGIAALLVVLAGCFFVAMVAVSTAIAAGAPGWLNLIVLVFAWDAARFGTLAVHVVLPPARLRPRQ